MILTLKPQSFIMPAKMTAQGTKNLSAEVQAARISRPGLLFSVSTTLSSHSQVS